MKGKKKNAPFVRRRSTIIIGIAIFLIALGASLKISYLTVPPGKDKECDPLNPEQASDDKLTTIHIDETLPWFQKGGIINDASCVDQTAIFGVVAIEQEEDIRNALQFARESKLKVSIAGVKHSMGGHAFSKGNIVLDMTGFNAITVNQEKSTITVQSGATWHDIQSRIHPQYAVKAMQSTDIFTVGGSISVNAHGMDHASGAVENTIVSMRIMRPDGSVVTASRTQNQELYNLVVGGYGLFGIVLDVELELAPNDLYASERKIIHYADFPATFANDIAPDASIGLTYTHLSTAPGSFLEEGIVYLYKKSSDAVALSDIPPLGEISSIPLRRFVMNVSKYGGFFQTLRWWSEKYLEPKMESCSISRNQAQASGEACLVSRNEPMHDSVPYLRNSLKKETDILHEYFVPRENLTAFIDDMRVTLRENDTNLLNASIRVVGKERGFLTYAPKEAFSVVLYINQKTDAKGNASMKKVTQELIDLSVKHGGRFFLPYQLHYTKEQLHASYPEIDAFFAKKRLYDPNELFTNTWYETYKQS